MPQWMSDRIHNIHLQLEQILPADAPIPQPLLDAMRYSLSAGGKRMRPLFLLTTCQCFGGDTQDAMPYALALEMIHTYSLVHDDLPAMDNDDMRRGKPTCHKAFGESTAILAGDGLLSYAFEVMLQAAAKASDQDRQNHVLAVGHIATGCGVVGMIAGQCVDLQGEVNPLNLQQLERMYLNKTGGLFRAAVLAGAQIAGAKQAELDLLEKFANHLGLWFQVNDDILDVEADPSVIGKPVGSDQRQGKSTSVSLLGIKEAKAMRQHQRDLATQCLQALGSRVEPLEQILEWLCNQTG